MRNAIRIRTDLPMEKLYSWPNPKHRPIKDPSKKFEKRQKELDADPARWKAACQFAGL
jgi:hypothetical protein